MISKSEILVDAIGFLNGIHDPLSIAYRIKNPLLVKSFGRPGKHEIDSEGRRVFESLISGYRACLFDMETKISGTSRSGLRIPESALKNLLGVYGIKNAGETEIIIKFLRKALNDTSISGSTPLEYFSEQK